MVNEVKGSPLRVDSGKALLESPPLGTSCGQWQALGSFRWHTPPVFAVYGPYASCRPSLWVPSLCCARVVEASFEAVTLQFIYVQQGRAGY